MELVLMLLSIAALVGVVHSLAINYSTEGGGAINSTFEINTEANGRFGPIVVPASSSVLINCELDAATMDVLLMKVTDGDLTVTPYPDDGAEEEAGSSIELTAGIPFLWYALLGTASPFSGVVESLRLQNDGTTSVTFNLSAGQAAIVNEEEE